MSITSRTCVEDLRSGLKIVHPGYQGQRKNLQPPRSEKVTIVGHREDHE